MALVDREQEVAALIALLRRGDRLWHHYAMLIDATGSAIAVLRGEYEEPGDPHALTLFNASEPSVVNLDAIIAEIRQWSAEGMDLVTVLDDAYPDNLRGIHNRPPLLFIRGRLDPDDDQAIAVVGTRQPTEAGIRAAASMSTELAEAGYTVISGLAQGIDTAVHQAALATSGRTIAVIGTGLRRAYPPTNRDLQGRLGEEMAVLSQFWPDSPPTRTSFPMRNVVMSGLALATVVIEASGASGARMQARFALEHGRPVFLMRSLMQHSWAREYAKRPGTHVVASAAEVVEQLQHLHAGDRLSV
jgi:DNA processing protein